MKKILKRILIIMPLILIALISFLVISSYFEHRELIAEEKEKYPAPGKLVEIDGTKIHVYAEGQGDQTLLEAIYWANLYPKEVRAVIGLDPLVPGYIEQAEEKPSLSTVITILTRTGLVRNQQDVFDNNFQAVKKDYQNSSSDSLSKSSSLYSINLLSVFCLG